MGVKTVAHKRNFSTVSSSSSTPSTPSCINSNLCTPPTTMARPKLISNKIFEEKHVKPNKLENHDLEEVMADAGFPEGTNIYFPTGEERPDSLAKGWICFYTYPFKIGVKWPMSDLIRHFIGDTGLLPCQLMPQTWRILHSLDVLAEKYGLDFEPNDLWYSYELRGTGKGRYTLRTKSEKNILIVDADKINDRRWNEKFFFVEKSSLGLDGVFLPEKFQPEDFYKTPKWKQNVDAELRVEKILKIDRAERDYVTLMSIGEEDPVSQDDAEKDNAESDEIEILPSNTPAASAPTPKSSPHRANPSPAPSKASSSAKRKGLSDEVLLASAMKRRNLSPRTDIYRPGPSTSSPVTPSKKASSNDPPVNRITFELSDELCQLTSFEALRHEIGALQAPGAQRMIAETDLRQVLWDSAALSFQSMQGVLTATDRLHAAMRGAEGTQIRLKGELAAEKQSRAKLEEDKKGLELEKEGLKRDKEELEKAKVVLEKKNDVLKKKLAAKKEKMKVLREKLGKRKEQLQDVAAFYLYKGKAELMQQFLNGESSSWSPQEVINTFEEVFASKEPGLEEEEDEKEETETEESGSS